MKAKCERSLVVLSIIASLIVIMMLLVRVTYAAEADNPCINAIVSSNWGTYSGIDLWINCGADFSNVKDSDKVRFFLCEKEGEAIDQAIIVGDKCEVGCVPGTFDSVMLRNSKLDSGMLIPEKQKPGNYYIGCVLESDDSECYYYRKFTIFSDSKEYVKAAVDKLLLGYKNMWFRENQYDATSNYIGLGGDTGADSGRDWEAWIFSALGYDVDSEMLISYDGKTYLDALGLQLDYYKENDSFSYLTSKDIFRFIAGICACGEDPRTFHNINLIELMMNNAYISSDGTGEKIKGLAKTISVKNTDYLLGNSTSNDVLFASYLLLGLEIAGANDNEGYTQSVREAGIRTLLLHYGADVIKNGDYLAPDWYTMALLPMQFLEDDQLYKADICAALENMKNIISESYLYANGAMAFLEAGQDNSDMFALSNPNTEAIAVNTLIVAGVTTEDYDNGFSKKQYGSLLTALLGDLGDENAIMYYGVSNRMATYQTLGALVDLVNGRSSFALAAEKYRTNYPQYFVPGEDDGPVVAKKKQPMTVKPVLKKVSFKKLKKKAQVVKGALIVKHNKGKVSYKRISGSKKLTINKKTGRITVKKKTKKGTYKIRVKVTAAGNSLFKAGSKIVTVKIRVK